MKTTSYFILFLTGIVLTSCEHPIVVDYPTTTSIFKAKDYSRDRYFFLDNAYRRYYIKKYAPQGLQPVPPPKIVELSVWRLYTRIATEKQSNIRSVKVDTVDQFLLYELLERDKHYYLDPVEGFIRFSDSISFNTEQQVAIYMRTAESTNAAFGSMQKGGFKIVTVADTVHRLGVGDTIWQLWTIRPREQIQKSGDDTSRFYLPWRHVYGPIDYSDAATLKIAALRLSQDSDKRLEKNGATFFADIMGLTANNVPKIQNHQIYERTFNDLIFPPYDTSFYGLEPFNNPALGDYRDSLIYRYSDDSPVRIEHQSLWEIEATSRRDLLE